MNSLTCIIGGPGKAPSIGLDVNAIEGRPGDEFTLMPTLNAEDALVSEQGVKDIMWTSSDNGVFTVTKNADGSITIRIIGEGSASLTARFGNSPLDEFIGTGSFGVGTGNGTGGGTGGGSGTGSGTGTGSGSGTGSGAGSGGGSGTSNGDCAGSNGQVNVTNGDTSNGALDGVDATDADGGGSLKSVAALTTALPQGPKITKLSFSELTGQGAGASGAGGGGGGGSGGGGQSALEVSVTNSGAVALYAVIAGGSLVLGGVRRAGSYELAKDPYLKSSRVGKKAGKRQSRTKGSESE